MAPTEEASRLPKAGDRVDVAAATIADGYADDAAATAYVDESKNRTQTNLRIGSGGTAAAAGGLTVVDDLSADSPTLSETVTAATAPTWSVRHEFGTALLRYLPMARDLVQTAEGHAGAAAIDGPPAFAAIIANAGVATGYAADAPGLRWPVPAERR